MRKPPWWLLLTGVVAGSATAGMGFANGRIPGRFWLIAWGAFAATWMVVALWRWYLR